mgnify:CR=1 FL=1
MKALVEKTISLLFKAIGQFNKQNLIYLESFHGTQYSDNPKAIYEWLKKEYPEYTLVWGVTKGSEKPFREEKVSYVLRFSFKWFLTMPRARFWITNTRQPLWLHKSKKTTYLQTWHGTPLKKLGRDIEEVNIPGYSKESYGESFSKESARWDYLVSPSQYATEIFRSAFGYQGPVLETGYPRNDCLTQISGNAEKVTTLKKKIGLPTDKQLVLYAPTWREKEQRVNGKYQFSTPFPFDEVVENLGEEAILLVRMHYLVAQAFDFDRYADKVINVSTGYDMAELLAVSDLLITDYSSSMFDYAITGNPMIFYIPDQKEYDEEMRGFYFPMENHLPGEMASDKDSLIQTLITWKKDKELIKTPQYATFKETFTTLETGQAAKQVTQALLQNRED